MQKKSIRILFMGMAIAFSLTFIDGCKKNDLASNEKQSPPLNQALASKLPSTPQEKLLVENLGKVTSIFKELYKDKSNLKEVNAAIYSKAYTDESVFLKDLIYYENSRISKNKNFIALCKKWNINAGNFGENFWKEANKLNDKTFQTFLQNLNNSSRINSSTTTDPYLFEVTVYFPYSDNYVFTNDPVSSLVTATADADQGWGDKSFYDASGILQWTQVLINDDYAFTNPTHIIGINGIEALDITADISTAPPPPPPPPGVSRVFIGEGVCKNQYDRLISFTGNGGGSEIKYCHLSGYLQPVNGQVTTFQDIASVDFNRKNIRQKNWLRVFIIWDNDWNPNNLEQVLAIYEEDNTNTKTFNGSIGTSVTVTPGSTITGTIGYTVTVQSQDDIIRELKISRNSYFAGAFQDQGWGFSPDATFLPLPFTHGWPAYEVDYQNKSGANVGWTWPYNTF